MLRFSLIVPVYNRPTEVEDLCKSLLGQSSKNFELIIVEDGSTITCETIVNEAIAKGLNAKYYFKDNEGRSIARNYGLEHASGEYFVFVDSDCVLPCNYFKTLETELDKTHLDCFGGPDAANDNFSDIQKAINYAMTSILTTGGIRGGKIRMERFVPRTFNMGYSRTVYDKLGGFREMFSEDIDMSTRIRNAGFTIGLIRPAYVWHKRRINLIKFFRQVYVFGMSRITLRLLYPGSLKLVHTLPAFFVLGSIALIFLAIFVSPWFLAPLAVYFTAILFGAILSTKSFKVALLAIPASIIQLSGYGLGFLKAWFIKILLGKGRDINEEILIRKGK